MTTLSTLKVVPSFFPEKNGPFYDHHGYKPSRNTGTVPPGFPTELRSSLVWTAAEVLEERGEWLLYFTLEDVASIEAAVRLYIDRKLPLAELTKENFVLSIELARKLDSVSERCHSGRGFCIIRGLNPAKYTETENILIQAGVSLYVASLRGFQDEDRVRVLSHVADAARFLGKHPNTLGPGYSNVYLPFHNDLGDLIGFYAIKTDATSGRTFVSSAWKVYNELVKTRKDVLNVMAQSWVHDTFSNDKAKYPPNSRPLIHQRDGKVFFVVARRPFTGSGLKGRDPLLPEPGPELIEALDVVHYTAEKECIVLPIEQGDIYFLNNFSLLHGREAFETTPDQIGNPQSGRHILKLFLRDPRRGWKIPETLKPIQERLFGANGHNGEREEIWELLDHQHALPVNWGSNG